MHLTNEMAGKIGYLSPVSLASWLDFGSQLMNQCTEKSDSQLLLDSLYYLVGCVIPGSS